MVSEVPSSANVLGSLGDLQAVQGSVSVAVCTALPGMQSSSHSCLGGGENRRPTQASLGAQSLLPLRGLCGTEV